MSKKQKKPKKWQRKVQKTVPKMMKTRLLSFFLIVVVVFIVLFGRAIYISATAKDEYTKRILDQQHYFNTTIPFQRGEIIDANGIRLAFNERVYRVIFDPASLIETFYMYEVKDKNSYNLLSDEAKKQMINQSASLETTKNVLQECFGVDPALVQECVDEKATSRYCVLKKEVSYDAMVAYTDKVALLKEEKKNASTDTVIGDVVGVWLEDDFKRAYSYPAMASDILGYVADGNEGLRGIEGYYNSELNGIDGRSYGYLDGNAILQKSTKEPTNGNSMILTLDVGLQQILEKHVQSFNDAHSEEEIPNSGAKNIAVLAMNPNTGAILGMASSPAYDLSNPGDLSRVFSEKQLEEMKANMTEEEYQVALSVELERMWQNFCVTSTFEPGSTMKPLTFAMAFETGKLKGDETFYCGGFLHVGDHDIHCANRKGHGTLTLEEIMEQSCNVGMMQIAELVGAEAFCRYQSLFGIGEYTGIDLPGEQNTSSLVFNETNMSPVNLATSGFGQTFQVSMIQMATAFSSLVNGGNLYEPYLVQQIISENGNVLMNREPMLLRKTISEETGGILKGYLRKVVENGTGTDAEIEGYDIGGKTGTAEKLPRGNGKYVNSFISYVPQDNPQLLLYVLIDEPNTPSQDNSRLCTALTADIMKEVLPYLRMLPTTVEVED